MAKLSLMRGLVIAAIGLTVVILGSSLFDMSYQAVEPILGTTSIMMTDKEILPNQFINTTINSDQLHEHNIVVVHMTPSSGLVKLNGIEPNGMTFEKESKGGRLYHILQKSNQAGSYLIKISDTGSQPVRIDVILGEDPLLSKNCDVSYGIKCIVQMSMVMVAIGLIAFIIGILIGLLDFKKERKLRKK